MNTTDPHVVRFIADKGLKYDNNTVPETV